MAHILKTRVAETSTSTGAGDFTLAGAVTAHRTFASVCSLADTTEYVIYAVDSSGVPSGEWEEGVGTYSALNTLTRTTPKSGSAATPVSFSAGTKVVIMTPLGDRVGGLPKGGSTGQVLKKTNGNDFELEWGAGGPSTTDALTEGFTNFYHTAARVRSVVLTGLSTAAGTVVTAAHTVLEAIGFLQRQVSDAVASLASHIGNTSNPHGTTAAQAGAIPTGGLKTVNGNALEGSGNITIAGAAAPLTLASGTITASSPALTATQTWNAAGVTFVAEQTDVSNSASAAGSLLRDWKVGGVSKVNIRKDGQLSYTDTLRSLSNIASIYTTDGLMACLDSRMLFYKNITMAKSAATISGDGAYGSFGYAPLTVQGGNCGPGQDGQTGLTLHGGNASPTATTNIVGGTAILRGGDGSSGSSGAAHGGAVNIYGGVSYGTGSPGALNLGYTGSAARGAVKCWSALTMDAVLALKSYTVSTLPSASTSGAGAMAYVTDSNATTYRATVAGGGSDKVTVTSDGTNWIITG